MSTRLASRPSFGSGKDLWWPASILGLAIPIGGLVALAPEVAVGTLLLVGLSAAFWSRPALTLIGAGVFFAIQDLLVGIAGIGFGESVATLTKQADEGAILVMFLISLLRFPRRIPMSIFAPMIGLLAAGVLSSVFSGIGVIPTGLDAFLMTKGFLLFVICSRVPLTASDIRRAILVLGVLGLIVFLTGPLTYLTPGLNRAVGFGDVEYRVGLPSAQGFFDHPGTYQQVMTFLLFFALSAFRARRNQAGLAMTLTFLAGALLSLRLRPLLFIPPALVIALLLHGRGGRSDRSRAAPLVGVLAVFAVLFGATDLPSTILAVKAPELESGARVSLTQTSIAVAKDRFPFGSGFGTFGGYVSVLYYSPVYREYGLSDDYGLSKEYPVFAADTHWPYVLAETGILGFACYGAILLMILRALLHVARGADEQWTRIVAFGATVALIEALFEAFVSPVFQESMNVYLLLGAAGVALSAAEAEKHRIPVGESQGGSKAL